jgi:hypothetical protein
MGTLTVRFQPIEMPQVQGLVLVTSNEGEFRRVGGLRVENWRAG